jgi:hypothetical protein
VGPFAALPAGIPAGGIGYIWSPLASSRRATTPARYDSSYMQFPQVHDVPLHDIVSIEHLQGTYEVEGEDQTYMYRVAFKYLLERSMDPDQSRLLISATTGDIWA